MSVSSFSQQPTAVADTAKPVLGTDTSLQKTNISYNPLKYSYPLTTPDIKSYPNSSRTNSPNANPVPGIFYIVGHVLMTVLGDRTDHLYNPPHQ